MARTTDTRTREYSAEITVEIFDRWLDRPLPHGRITMTVEFTEPDDPRAMLTLEALREAVHRIELAEPYVWGVSR